MAKVYKFPEKSQQSKHKHYAESKTRIVMKNAIDILLEAYEYRIKQLREAIYKSRQVDGTTIHSPKKLIQFVQEIEKMFEVYSISNYSYTFTTINNKVILYFTDKKIIGIYDGKNKEDQRKLTTGEFIKEYEGYPFTFILDQKIYDILTKRIQELSITVETLKHTEI